MLKNENTDMSFKFLQWNTLATSCCDEQAFPKVSKASLGWDKREQLFIKIFKEQNPSILCLQEVDNIDQFVKILQTLNPNYKYFYEQKIRPTMENIHQGIAIFYDSSMFTPQSMKRNNYVQINKKPLNQFNLAVIFIHNKSKKVVELITTHLISNKDNFETRTFEVSELIKVHDDINLTFEKDGVQSYAKIICGDFNAEPDEEGIILMKNRKDLKSVFEDATFTTYKMRDKTLKRVIDYIFYGGCLEIESRTELCTDLPEFGYPSEQFPSDHLMLACTFKLN